MSGLHLIQLPALSRVVPATVWRGRSDRQTCQCSQLVLQVSKGGNLRSYRLPSLGTWNSDQLLDPTACFVTTRHQSYTSARYKREREIRTTRKKKVLVIDPLGTVLVDGLSLNKKKYRTLPVVICEPEPEDVLPELVQSVLENFHEDTEPWFFREFPLGPSYKKIDWDAIKQGAGSSTGSLIEGNGALLNMQSDMPPQVQQDFVLGHALLAAEAQVQASMAAYAEQKARRAPVSASHFRTFGTTEADVHYPDFFEGYWEVDCVLISLDVPKGIDNMLPNEQVYLQKHLDVKNKFIERYIKHNGNVISDRLYQALALHTNEEENTCGIWDPERPGLWRVSTMAENGNKFESQYDYNVSLRTFDSGPGYFETSEFTRQWVMDGISNWPDDLPPDVSGSHTFQCYKWDAKSKNGPDEMTSIMTNAVYKPLMEHGGQILPSREFLLEILSQTTVPTFVEKIVARHRRIDDPHAEESDEART